MTTPGTYEFQVADLLHDPNLSRWSESQLDGYINEARRQLVMDTGCLRTLQASYVTQGVEQYQFGSVSGAAILTGGSGYSAPSVTFSGGGGSGAAATLTQSGGAVNSIVFTSYGSGYTSAPTATVSDTGGGTGCTVGVGIISLNTYDFLGVHVFWGTQRYSLDWQPFSKFSAWFRPYTPAAYQRQPACWASYGEASIFVGPTPDQSYATEFDTVVLPTDFAIGDSTTPEVIPLRNQDPIKFYAAHLAKFNAQNYGEAESFLQKYQQRLREVCASYTRRIGSIYAA